MEAIEIRNFNDDMVFQVQKLLDDNNIFAEAYHWSTSRHHDCICVDIDGDWKHDHACADWLIAERLGGIKFNEHITEDTGCDWYPSTHYYYFEEAKHNA